MKNLTQVLKSFFKKQKISGKVKTDKINISLNDIAIYKIQNQVRILDK